MAHGRELMTSKSHASKKVIVPQGFRGLEKKYRANNLNGAAVYGTRNPATSTSQQTGQFGRLGVFSIVKGPHAAYPFIQLFSKKYLKICLRFFARQNA